MDAIQIMEWAIQKIKLVPLKIRWDEGPRGAGPSTKDPCKLKKRLGHWKEKKMEKERAGGIQKSESVGKKIVLL